MKGNASVQARKSKDATLKSLLLLCIFIFVNLLFNYMYALNLLNYKETIRLRLRLERFSDISFPRLTSQCNFIVLHQ